MKLLWVLIAIVAFLLYILLRFFRGSVKSSAVQNAFLAKYTYDLISPDQKKQVHVKALQIMKRGGLSEECFSEMSEMLQFSFYALAMAELGIPPVLPNEEWHYVKNPYMALHRSEYAVRVEKVHWKNTHGVEIDLKYFDHLLAPNHKKNDIIVTTSNPDNHSKVINDYDRDIELDLKDARAYYHQGLAYDKLENYSQSIENYDKAIELNPKYSEAYNNRGLAYDDLGNHNQAIKDFDKVIELDPKDAAAYIIAEDFPIKALAAIVRQ